MKRLLPLLLPLLLGQATGWADQVVLANGSKVEGVVENETETEITLRTPEGRLKFNRRSVRSVTRSAPGTPPPSPAGLQTPRVFEGVWTTLSTLDRLKAEATRARLHIEATEKVGRDLIERARAHGAAMEEAARQLELLQKQMDAARAAPGRAAEAAQLAARMEALNQGGAKDKAELRRLEREIDRERKQAADSAGRIAEYTRELEAFLLGFPVRRDEYLRANPGGAAGEFFARVEERLRKHARTLTPHVLTLENLEGEHLVTLWCSGIKARFQLQTGISHLVLSPALARQLGLQPTGRTVSVRLSEGGTLDCRELPDVPATAGDLTLAPMKAVLSPEPLPGVDGIFGLGLLRGVLFSLDLEKGRLVVIEVPTGP